jgi:hypothetical protein
MGVAFVRDLCLLQAYYNWAIAISDRAKIRGRTKEAEELWKQACVRYDQSVQLNWNNPQVLQLQSLCRSCYWSIIFCVLSPTFCSFKLSPNFTAINSRVARVSFRLIERCQCWVEVTEALLLPGDMCFLSFVLLLARL